MGNALPRVLWMGHSGKRILIFFEFLPRVLHSGKRFFQKKMVDGIDGVKSFPSASMALREGFPECTIFGTRGRPLSRERHPWSLFPECYTRRRLPRVHLALGEAGLSRRGGASLISLSRLSREWLDKFGFS
jgi:hypothetical protein